MKQFPKKWYISVDKLLKREANYVIKSFQEEYNIGVIKDTPNGYYGIMNKSPFKVKYVSPNFGVELTFDEFKEAMETYMIVKDLKVNSHIMIDKGNYKLCRRIYGYTLSTPSNNDIFDKLKIKDKYTFVSKIVGYREGIESPIHNFPFLKTLDDLKLVIIALLQVEEDINKNTSNMGNTIKISAKDAKRIYDIACNSWKVALFNLWATDIIEKNDIVIENTFYKKMRDACTKEQHELFDEIFGKLKTHNLPINTKLFTKDGRIIGNAIIIDYCETRKIYTLKSDYGNVVNSYNEADIRKQFYLDFETESCRFNFNRPHKYAV